MKSDRVDQRRWPIRFGLFLVTFAAYAFSIGTPFYSSDAQVMYETTRSLTFEQSFAVPPSELPQVIAGQDGRFYSKYDPGLPLLAVPWLAAGDYLAMVFEANRYAVGAVAVMFVPVVAMAIAILAVTGIAQELYDSHTALGIGLLAAFATLSWPYSRLFFGEAVFAASLTCAIWFIMIGQRHPVIGVVLASLAIAIGILTRTSIVIYLPALTYFLRQSTPSELRLRRMVLLWIMPILAILGLLAHNHLRFGNIFDNGYQDEQFQLEFWVGLLGLLVSPGKSIFLYAPPLIMSGLLWRRFHHSYPTLSTTLGIAGLSAFVVFGAWWAWHGGWVWGPRFLVPLVGLGCLPWGMLPASKHWVRGAIVLVLLGIGMQVVGVFTNVTPHYAEVFGGTDPNAAERYHRIHYDPAESPIVAGTRRLFNGNLERPALLHLGDTGLPPQWAIGVPLMIGLLGIIGGRMLIIEMVRDRFQTPDPDWRDK